MVCMEMLMSQGCLVIAHSCKFSIQFFHSKSHCRSSTLFKTSAISYCTFKLNNKIKIERKMLNKYFEAVDNWIPQNDGLVRTTPILLGCSSIIALLLNRTFSGISFIADASSGHSRADLLALALAITMLLTGLIWKSVEPKEPPIPPHEVTQAEGSGQQRKKEKRLPKWFLKTLEDSKIEELSTSSRRGASNALWEPKG